MTVPTPEDAERAAPPGGLFAGHADQYRPLGSYAALTVLFNGALAASLVAAGRAGRLPERYDLGDLALVGVGTFKLSRLVARDRVTSAIRAPFTRFQGDAGHGEVDEEARGTGLRRAVGELLVCDYCLGQWFAAAGIVGLAAAPRTTRALGAIYTSYALADFLQVAYVAVQERS